ncbi:MAG: hypothetical protein HY518_04145, partial [Candidatus Aenigmarchaeota archaeon]|nr:hypothetical protein [Candidatus Aenigmarchaeota archaeon]
IQIVITDVKDDYCWTPNPYKEVDSWRNSLARSVLSATFLNPPVRDNTAFLEDSSVVLLPTQTAEQKGKSFFEALDRKWWWGWP